MSNAVNTLSVAIIVRNDEEGLAHTLASVRDIADEIVVLDTGSQDASIEVAEQVGAKVIQQEWQNDFSIARNTCLEACTCDWVFWVDAGEVLASPSQLRAFIREKAQRTNAYLTLIRTPPLPRTVGGEQVGAVRLMPRMKGLEFRGRVRENILASLQEQNISIDASPAILFRGERELRTEYKHARAHRNLELIDLETKTGGITPALLNGLGEAHADLGDHTSAMRFYRRTIATATKGGTDQLEGYYGLLSTLDQTQSASTPSEQISLCISALEIYPLDMQLLCALGGYMQNQDETPLAIRSYRLAFENGQINPLLWHVQTIREVAASCLAGALQAEGEVDEALNILTEALEDTPSSTVIRRQLVDLHVRRGAASAALALLSGPADQWPQIDAIRQTVQGACLGINEHWEHAMDHLHDAYQSGFRESFCLRYYVRSLVENNRNQEATAVLIEWREAGDIPPAAEQLLASLLHEQSVTQNTGTRIDKPEAAKPNIAGVKATQTVE